MSEDTTMLSRRKVLEEALLRIDKQFGKGAAMLMDEKKSNEGIDVISTGSLMLNDAIGIGGLPKGRVVEVFGPEASGKTTIALQAIAEVQKNNGIAAFIDAEHALDIQYAKNLGVKVNELVLSQPDYGEQALEIADMLIRSGAVDLIVVDSVAALVPKTELEGDMGDTHVGLQARLMSQALRKLTPLVHKSNTCLVFINQIRQNINSMPFAPKETTTGGNALKFYSSLRLDIRRIESLKDKEGVHYGNKVAIKIVKNKMSPPFKVVHAHVYFGKGISKHAEIFELGIQAGIIKQSGSWISVGTEKVCQGKETFINLVSQNQKMYNEIEKEVKSFLSKREEERNNSMNFKEGNLEVE
jgi:recombination protein RecA